MAETKSKSTAALEKEIAELKAALGQKELAEAVKDNGVRSNEEYMKQSVTIKLFKDNGKYRDDVYVAVNDRSFLIKRGVEVTVPRFVEQALKNSLSQDEYVASLVEKLQNDYENSI
ncbi:MAG: hypothetical protein E7551_06055 [Ruminococcaceae bacterium]|nr:hypothetical protein [Oscillospiraceae bacterium]